MAASPSSSSQPTALQNLKPYVSILGHVCFVLGFASIIASIAVWNITKEPDIAHGNGLGFSSACGRQRFSYFRAALNGLPKADLTSSFSLYSDSLAYNCFVQRFY